MADDKNQQIFDVAKPGKTAATASARPVIVNHGPMLKDPMVSDKPPEAVNVKADASDSPKSSDSRKIITPPSETQSKAQDSSGDPKKESSNSSSEGTNQEPQSTGSSLETSNSNDAGAAAGDEKPKNNQSSAIVDAVVDQAAAKKKGEPTKEEVARLAELEKMVESKQYFVKLKPSIHKKRTSWAVAFIIILLIIAGAYLSIDAGLIDLEPIRK